MYTRMSDCMIRYPFTATPEHTLSEAQELMREREIRHLPVLDSGRLVGLLSERDLKAAMNLDQSVALRVGDVMKSDVFIVDQNTPVCEVAREMADEKLGSVVVINSRHDVVGIFTTTDALRLLADKVEDQTLEGMFVIDDCYVDAFTRKNADDVEKLLQQE